MANWPIYIYRVLLRPCLYVVMRALAFFNAKIRNGLCERALKISPPKDVLNAKNRIWIHVASGEFEYAKPVIREWKRAHPNDAVVVSYFSPSVKKSIENTKDVDFAFPTPLETISGWRSALESLKPSALLIARTDLWPEMLTQAKLFAIPSLLFSATLTESSGRSGFLMRPMMRYLLKQLSNVYCVDSADQNAFLALGGSALVKGDTRYDQVFHRLSHAKAIDLQFPSDLPIFCLGSSWREDENVFLPVIEHFRGRIRFIVCPHEPEPAHVETLVGELKSRGLSFRRFSQKGDWREDVLVIDQVGYLAELYLHARFAFVGGSFRKTVHSVMEALGAGCLTFLGPLHHNNREALEFQKVMTPLGLPIVQVVHSSSEWIEKLEQSLLVADERPAICAQVQKKCGATTAVLSWLERTLN